MRNRIILIVLVFLTVITSKISAQVEITKSNTSYGYYENVVDLSFYVIKNTSDSIVFIWFDKDKNNDMPLIARVYSYIFRSRRGSDFSFFSLANELRVGSAKMLDGTVWLTVGSTFIKELYPNQTFTVIVKDSSINTFSEDFIEIVPYSVYRGISGTVGTDWYENFKYKEDFIVF